MYSTTHSTKTWTSQKMWLVSVVALLGLIAVLSNEPWKEKGAKKENLAGLEYSNSVSSDNLEHSDDYVLISKMAGFKTLACDESAKPPVIKIVFSSSGQASSALTTIKTSKLCIDPTNNCKYVGIPLSVATCRGVPRVVSGPDAFVVSVLNPRVLAAQPQTVVLTRTTSCTQQALAVTPREDTYPAATPPTPAHACDVGFGVKRNIPKSLLSSWTKCYDIPYKSGTRITDVKQKCPDFGPDTTWFVGAEDSQKSDTILMGAQAPRSLILTPQTGTVIAQNKFTAPEGSSVYFYMKPGYSIGFADTSRVRLFECDFPNWSTPLDRRLCWHLDALCNRIHGCLGGWSAGTLRYLNFDSRIRKVIYYRNSSCVGSIEVVDGTGKNCNTACEDKNLSSIATGLFHTSLCSAMPELEEKFFFGYQDLWEEGCNVQDEHACGKVKCYCRKTGSQFEDVLRRIPNKALLNCAAVCKGKHLLPLSIDGSTHACAVEEFGDVKTGYQDPGTGECYVSEAFGHAMQAPDCLCHSAKVVDKSNC